MVQVLPGAQCIGDTPGYFILWPRDSRYGIFTIPDATVDARFDDNPLVTGEPHIRFYAGCPLVVPNGSKLGTLCLIDRVPRDLSEEDMALLRDLARMAEQELAAILEGVTHRKSDNGVEQLQRIGAWFLGLR